MKFILIILGILIILSATGVLTSVFIFHYPKAKQASILSSQPVTTKPLSLTLNVNNPDDNLLSFDGDLLVQGTTAPKASVVLNWEGQNQALQADQQGNFSATIKLDEGTNLLTITAFDEIGNSKFDKRMIFYSTEKLSGEL